MNEKKKRGTGKVKGRDQGDTKNKSSGQIKADECKQDAVSSCTSLCDVKPWKALLMEKKEEEKKLLASLSIFVLYASCCSLTV